MKTRCSRSGLKWQKKFVKANRMTTKLAPNSGKRCIFTLLRSETRNPSWCFRSSSPTAALFARSRHQVMVRQRRRYMDRLSHATTQHSSDSHTPFGELAVFFGSSCSTGDTTSSEVFVLLTTITKQVLPITRLVESTAVQAVTVMYGER